MGCRGSPSSGRERLEAMREPARHWRSTRSCRATFRRPPVAGAGDAVQSGPRDRVSQSRCPASRACQNARRSGATSLRLGVLPSWAETARTGQNQAGIMLVSSLRCRWWVAGLSADDALSWVSTGQPVGLMRGWRQGRAWGAGRLHRVPGRAEAAATVPRCGRALPRSHGRGRPGRRMCVWVKQAEGWEH